MIEMPITSDDVAEVTPAANERQDLAERTGARSWGEKYVPREQERRNHVLGRLGELKCAQYLGLELATDFYGVDCKILDVRTRRVDTGRDLPLRPIDNMRLPQVLVWINRECTKATIVGWLCGWQAHQRVLIAKAEAGFDVLWQQLKGVWFIPPPYHSIASLEDWILVGHPLHWAPEEYRK